MALTGLPADLPARLDHTLLRPDATTTDVLRHCAEAQEYGFRVVFVPPCHLAEAATALADSSVRLGAPIGFPLGFQTTSAKVGEAVEAYLLGARELDMVINLNRLKSGDYDLVRSEIAEVVRATPDVGVKVILETCYLTEQEKLDACRLAVDAGARYVKSSTGFGPGGATVEDIRLMSEAVSGRAGVKASGGIRDVKAVRAMVAAGADRIGTSAGVAIMKEWWAEQGAMPGGS